MATALNSRENTFKVDLSELPKRPSYEAIHSFIHQTIGLQLHQVQRLQINHAQKCAHVKCKDLKTAEEVVRKHNEKHEIEVEGRKYKVRLVIDCGYTEVKVHDLSESITKEDIITFLRHYGDVHDIKDLVWGPNFHYTRVPSGVRVVTMTLRSHIKSFVTICGEETLITYRSQPQSCRHCSQLLHPGSTCVANKKLKKQQLAIPSVEPITRVDDNPTEPAEISRQTNTSPSYANVTKESTLPSQNPSESIVDLQTKSTGYTQRPEQKPQQNAKRSVNRTNGTPVNSPPRKKKDCTEKTNTEPIVTTAETTDDNRTGTNDNSDVEPDPENVAQWLECLKKQTKNIEKNLHMSN